MTKDELDRLCKAWNSKYPVGQVVTVNIQSLTFLDTTFSEAYTTQHAAVVKLKSWGKEVALNQVAAFKQRYAPSYSSPDSPTVCETCFRLDRDHPLFYQCVNDYGFPFLRRLCDGSLIKTQ